MSRKFDIHTGVDLYCFDGTPALSIEEGIVVEVQDFTGPKADSPWWNDTQAVLVEGKSGVICYGEIKAEVKIGDRVHAGKILGDVIPVLKKDKGRPMSMLHFELYKHGTRDTVWWYHGDPRPDELLDPTELLLSLK